MNAGFSNLDTLKKNLLAGTMQGSVKFDEVIKQIGLWTFGIFEEQTNRSFARVVGDVEEFPCDRSSFVVSRYPIEALTAVETKVTESDDWEPQELTVVKSLVKKAGIIQLADGADVGKYWSTIRFTFTGGFWWEQNEPEAEDNAYPSAMPEGATALPHGLRGAWLAQCRLAWAAIDKLGTNTLTQGSTAQFVSGSLAGLDFIPSVASTLKDYTKMDLI